jgi:hypothetical protein
VFFEGAHDFADYPLRDIHAAVLAFCTQNGIEAFDLLAAFARSGDDAAKDALDPWHLSQQGHEIVARELAPLVVPRQNGARETR